LGTSLPLSGCDLKSLTVERATAGKRRRGKREGGIVKKKLP